ncbi:MAG TPA: PorP/SprF family type IX secretion system membrane protein [Bacteroidia bacterium]|jgi:type IX secretion system PorP/SprF family membrane protein|nr:PorP/SprF family type IX secretion system membrane protein [Bacteroidia bacterium]
MKKIVAYLLFAFAICGTPVFAQDFHLSQYDMASLYINPALTGMYSGEKGDFKIYNDYRSQWASLGNVPYSTEYLAFDMPVQKWGKNFGVGAYLIDNRAPAGSFSTMNFMTSIAYDIMSKENSNGKHYLTTGIQLGIFYKSFNPNSFTYDDQYSASEGGFDQSLPSGESFSKTGLVNFDANYGLFYKYIEETKIYHPFFGFSIQHLTMPNESFTTVKSHLPMRFNFQGGCDLQVTEKLKLIPEAFYMTEAGATEFDAGLLAFYKINTTQFQAMLGGDVRVADAVVIHLGIKYGEDIFRFSYDINTSYLNAFTGGRGAWELSLIITGMKGHPLFGKGMF